MSHYKKLIETVLEKGIESDDRTGVGVIKYFGYQCRFNLQEGFPIVTEKKVPFKNAVTELIWMIGSWTKEPAYEGIQRTNIKFLLDNDCHIWTEWPYKEYLKYANSSEDWEYIRIEIDPSKNSDIFHVYTFTQKEFEQKIINDKEFAIKFGDLGPVYQKQWREFTGKKKFVDQLQKMIDTLKDNPNSRRNLTSFWNPTELDEMLLEPCHILHQVFTKELTFEEKIQFVMKYTDLEMENLAITEEVFKETTPKYSISLQMYQRSSDCGLGVPSDWIFYSLLTHIFAELTNMIVDEFIWVSGDTHIYTNAIDACEEVLNRETFPYPKLIIKSKVDRIEDYKIEDFELENYQSGKFIKIKVAV